MFLKINRLINVVLLRSSDLEYLVFMRFKGMQFQLQISQIPQCNGLKKTHTSIADHT